MTDSCRQPNEINAISEAIEGEIATINSELAQAWSENRTGSSTILILMSPC